MALLARGDRDAAAERVKTALRKEPSDPAARHLAASLAMARDDLDGARAHYEAVLEERPDHTATLLRLARIEARIGNPERIGPLLRRAHESDPAALEPRLVLARYSIAQGDHETALEMVRNPDRSVREDPRALTIAAIALLEQDRPSQALEHLDRLLESRPQDARTYVLLARAYSALGQEEEARQHLERVLEFDEDNPTVLVVQARARIREGQPEAAREALERVPEEFRDLPSYLDARAELALATGNLEQAIGHYERAQEAAPAGGRVARLAMMHLRAGRPEKAEALLDEYLAQHGDDPEVLQARGDLYTSQGRDAAATEAYKAVLERDPAATSALNNLAWVMRKREPEEALRYAEHAVDLQPGDPRVIDTLAMVLLELGRSGQAVERMREAVALAPEAPVLRYHFAPVPWQPRGATRKRARSSRTLSPVVRHSPAPTRPGHCWTS